MNDFSDYLNEMSGSENRAMVNCCAVISFRDNEESFFYEFLSGERLTDTFAKTLDSTMAHVRIGNYKCNIYVVNRFARDYPRTIELVAKVTMEIAVTGRKPDYTVFGEYLGMETVNVNDLP